MTDYDLQAKEFMEKYNVSFTKEFVDYKPFFPEDKKSRNVWKITASCGNRSFSYTFGDSLKDSEVSVKWLYTGCLVRISGLGGEPRTYSILSTRDLEKAKEDYRNRCITKGLIPPPSDYSLLACLSADSYFDSADEFEFYVEFGYDPPRIWEDYRRIRDTYEACKKQAAEIQRVFSDCLEELREIQ